MKNLFTSSAPLVVVAFFVMVALSCTKSDEKKEASNNEKNALSNQGQLAATANDTDSQKNIVQVAAGSKDHSTLVTAVKAAKLVDVLSNPGPFTVFAPVNGAFEKLPKGTVEDLLKPEKQSVLADILQHHVFVGSLKASDLTDGRVLNQVDLNNVTISVKNGKVYVDEALVLMSIQASNGYIHVIDSVLLPKKK